MICKCVKGPDHVTIWRWTYAQTVSIKEDHITGGYNSRWMVEIMISSFKVLLDEALRAVKPEYMMMEIATKMTVYDQNPRHHAQGHGLRWSV